MEEGLRSGRPLGLVVKNRSSSGCLIVRKKSVDGVGGVGPAGSRKVFDSKKQKKRLSLVLSDSGSSDELFRVPRRRVGSETVRICSGLSTFEKGIVDESEIGRNRDRLDHLRHYEEGMAGRNGFDESKSERGNLDIFEFDEYDGFGGETMRRKRFNDSGIKVGGRRFLGSMYMTQSGTDREYETGSSRHGVYKRKNLYCDPTATGVLNLGDSVDNSRVKMNRDGTQLPLSLLREKLMGHSDESIRVQGKNGVLKVMLNKKKRFGGPLEDLDHHVAEEIRKGSRIEDIAKRTVVIRSPSSCTEKKLEKPGLVFHPEKSQMALQKSLSSKNSKDGEWDSENSDASLKLRLKNVEANDSKKRIIREEEKKTSPSLKLRPKNVESHSSRKRIRCEEEETYPCENSPQAIIKEGKVKRGSGTEKQKLRERIREMLLSAGWTIDYRPRRNRDYLDAVYINPSGTAYWSIIKAYDAYQKQLKDEDGEAKPSGECSSFTPISDEILSQLTRKTRKKIEKEMKRKQRDCSDSDNATDAAEKRYASTKCDVESMDSFSHEEKLSSFIKHGGKLLKNRMTENGSAGVNSKSKGHNAKFMHDGIEKPSSGSNPRMPHARKSRKLGRCTLLVRSSNAVQNSETDVFVPYTGKRTLLSWLIDSGTVGLSQKVQYMNRRRTRVMLEGWITRDGIHCGCCSKILTVSKFEIHAGSKLRQPFQHIYLDSGVSLLQCQIDAWNRQEDSERFNFHSIDIEGDDPNDDTCGICGDGGDLICCDGCPSTFHLSCLDIRMLPPGDWHCPNCTCKFCGVVSGSSAQGDGTMASALLKCSVCEKKYHKSCMLEMDAIYVDSASLVSSFCEQKCKELFEHLMKYRGIRHELEAGFSWSLIHRMDKDSDTSLRGLPQWVECNSKLAVAQTIMDECFLPIVDRRSRINLIHNVLYNTGSNLNRLNYSGFYTAILERGDEIISAASIRFHGTKLAEMPFIGTRHVYRRQGMCRRLFTAIESALCSLKVEKLIIPAIAELMNTWTAVFGFTPLEESLKQEMLSMNMLVFPDTDMLQKLLLEQESIEGNVTYKTSAKQKASKNKLSTKPEVETKSEMDSPVGHHSRGCNSAGHDPHGCDDAGLCCANEMTDEVAVIDNKSDLNADPRRSDGASHCSNELTDEVTATDNKSHMDSTTAHDPHGCDSAGLPFAKEVSDDVRAADSSSLDASYEVNIPFSVQLTTCSNSYSEVKQAQSTSGKKFMSSSDMIHDALEQGNKPATDCSVVVEGQSWKEGDMYEACEVNINIDCLEPVPSSGEMYAENTKEINENLDVSDSSQTGPSESSLQVKSV